MFDWLYTLVGMLLSFFNSITGSYALALLFYALVFKLLFLPFGIKQQKNQIKMAKLTPKIELIKAKYRGRTDQRTMQKQQEEIMALQQKEGYSPLSGCLPLLLQLPLIMLIYAVIRSPISYIATTEATPVERYNQIVSDGKVEDGELAEYNELCDKLEYYYPSKVSEKKEITKDDIVRKAYAEFVGDPAELKTDKLDQIQIVNQIKAQLKTDSLAAEKLEKLGINEGSIPDFELFGVNLADKPSFTNISLLVLIPILAAAFTYLSMLITKKLNANPAQTQVQQDAQTAASMKIMDLVMPLMTLWIAFSFSGMLGLYWIYQSILGVVQTVILAKAMPMPKYTEEELKAMKKAQKAAEKAQRAALKENPKVRSLHNIDEDDYESLPEISTDEKAKEKKSQGIDITDIKD